MKRIQQLTMQTANGNTLSFFYNPNTNLVVVDLVASNEAGGCELLRKTLDEEKLLAHTLPAIDVKATVVLPRRHMRSLCRTPDEWCTLFGVQVLDPDGWNRQAKDWDAEWNRPLTQSEFIAKFHKSTTRIINRQAYERYKHLI